MRPYMLWLAREYSFPWRTKWERALDPQHERPPTTGASILALHTYKTTGIRRLADDQFLDPGRARGAVQGGR
jgi:hypothetical protein